MDPVRALGPRLVSSSLIFDSSVSSDERVVVIVRCSVCRRSRNFWGDCIRSFFVGVGVIVEDVRVGIPGLPGELAGFSFMALPEVGLSESPVRIGVADGARSWRDVVEVTVPGFSLRRTEG